MEDRDFAYGVATIFIIGILIICGFIAFADFPANPSKYVETMEEAEFYIERGWTVTTIVLIQEK